jgi:transposase
VAVPRLGRRARGGHGRHAVRRLPLGGRRHVLKRHKNVTIHYAPTYSSWLNQVELWFGKIERDVISRGVFTSIPDLRRKIMRYIREGNKIPKPVKWTYSDIHHRIRIGPNLSVTGH